MADGLSSGFLTRHLAMKSQNSGLNFSGSLTVGGGFVGIMKIACSREYHYRDICRSWLWRLAHSHRVYVSIRRSAFSHLQSSDSKRPHVSQTVVADLLDDLWSHPEWSPYHRVPLCHGILPHTPQTEPININFARKFQKLPLAVPLLQNQLQEERKEWREEAESNNS